MRSLVALVVLGQILGCIAHQVFIPTRFPDCDSLEAEHTAAVAVDYINNKALHGYKHVLNRIDEIRVYSQAVKAECDVRMRKREGDVTVIAVKCHSSADSAEDVSQVCPKCGTLVALNDPKVVDVANAALSQFNADNNTLVLYKLVEISRGKQVLHPNSIHVEFAIAPTNCSAQDAQDHMEDCHMETGENLRFGFCKATRSQQPAPLQIPEPVQVQCEVYEHQETAFQAHLQDHHLKKNVASPGIGRTVLDLMHSHNNTLASHESHSAEAIASAPVVKRAVQAGIEGTMQPKIQLCPGKIRHFHV